jgi:hypothetical protein
MNRSYLNQSPRMFRFESVVSELLISKSLMSMRTQSMSTQPILKIRRARALFSILCLLAAFLTLLPSALGQGTADFTLSTAAFSPDAVGPGGTTSSNITIGTVNSLSATVNLSCQVTPQQTTGTPVCTVSPTSVTSPGSAAATITTSGLTPTVGYAVTISATDASGTISAQQDLTVLAVTPQFTITIQTAVAPGSVPAGSGGQGIVSINPINGYTTPPDPNNPTGGITLACASITPLVTIPPVCSFSPASIKITGSSVTSTITVSSYGPITTGAALRPRSFYSLWFPLPMLAVVSLGAAARSRRARKAWGLLALFLVSGALLLLPACANTKTTTTTPNGVTPNNSYTLTVVGVDVDGVISSNAGSTSTNPTVSLTVTSPTD